MDPIITENKHLGKISSEDEKNNMGDNEDEEVDNTTNKGVTQRKRRWSEERPSQMKKETWKITEKMQEITELCRNFTKTLHTFKEEQDNIK